MGISLKGHAPDFQYWVFDIDGKTWVAVNQSTPEPLNINFVGNYREWPSNLPLINTSGFDILGSTTAGTNNLGEKQGKVEWVWSGKRYLSTWVLSAGREISPADPEEGVPATFEYGLNFVGRTPYSGPTGGTVGSGGVTPPPAPAPVQTQTNAIDVSETAEALANANRALAASEAQGKVNSQALHTARVELQNAKDALAAAQSKATIDQAALMARLQEQLDGIEERTRIQLNVYRQAIEQAQRTPPVTTPPVTTPPVTTPPVTTPLPSPVVTTPAKSEVAPAGTDWVKLGLQLGAAYLLLK